MSEQVKFEWAFTAEGMKKSAAMKNIPRAQKYQLTRWMAETTKEAKRSAAAMQKSGKGRKTSHMGRNVGMSVSGTDENYVGAVGTGIGRTQSVKYAAIQDRGGETHPRVTPKLRKWAWAMFYETGDEKFKWTALTKKQSLDVKIPASEWFSGVVNSRLDLLHEMMQPAAVLSAAERM